MCETMCEDSWQKENKEYTEAYQFAILREAGDSRQRTERTKRLHCDHKQGNKQASFKQPKVFKEKKPLWRLLERRQLLCAAGQLGKIFKVAAASTGDKRRNRRIHKICILLLLLWYTSSDKIFFMWQATFFSHRLNCLFDRNNKKSGEDQIYFPVDYFQIISITLYLVW